MNKTLLTGAALAGILTSGFAVQANAAVSTSDAGISATVLDAKDKNKCETHGCKGKNSCKGKGGCKSGDNGCKGKNSCKGKGGCAVKDGKPAH